MHKIIRTLYAVSAGAILGLSVAVGTVILVVGLIEYLLATK